MVSADPDLLSVSICQITVECPIRRSQHFNQQFVLKFKAEAAAEFSNFYSPSLSQPFIQLAQLQRRSPLDPVREPETQTLHPRLALEYRRVKCQRRVDPLPRLLCSRLGLKTTAGVTNDSYTPNGIVSRSAQAASFTEISLTGSGHSISKRGSLKRSPLSNPGV